MDQGQLQDPGAEERSKSPADESQLSVPAVARPAAQAAACLLPNSRIRLMESLQTPLPGKLHQGAAEPTGSTPLYLGGGSMRESLSRKPSEVGREHKQSTMVV